LTVSRAHCKINLSPLSFPWILYRVCFSLLTYHIHLLPCCWCFRAPSQSTVLCHSLN